MGERNSTTAAQASAGCGLMARLAISVATTLHPIVKAVDVGEHENQAGQDDKGQLRHMRSPETTQTFSRKHQKNKMPFYKVSAKFLYLSIAE